jgi:hypothetical protein
MGIAHKRIDINKYTDQGQPAECDQRLKSKQSRTDQAIDIRIACLAHCVSCVKFDIVIDGRFAFIFVFYETLMWFYRQKPMQRWDCFAGGLLIGKGGGLQRKKDAGRNNRLPHPIQTLD